MFENWADTEQRQKIKKTANTNPLPLPTGVLYVGYATDNTRYKRSFWVKIQKFILGQNITIRIAFTF